MENKYVKNNNIIPIYVHYCFDNFVDEDEEFTAQYNNLLNSCFEGLYKKYDLDPAHAYALLSDERENKLYCIFDYKSTFNEILFSGKSEFYYNELVLLYEIFCWNVLYQKNVSGLIAKTREK